MALTVTINKRESLGSITGVFATVAFDSSYVTGGEPFTAASVGLDQFRGVLASPTSGYTIQPIQNTASSQALLKVYDAASAEVANGTDLSTDLASVTVIAFGV